MLASDSLRHLTRITKFEWNRWRSFCFLCRWFFFPNVYAFNFFFIIKSAFKCILSMFALMNCAHFPLISRKLHPLARYGRPSTSMSFFSVASSVFLAIFLVYKRFAFLIPLQTLIDRFVTVFDTLFTEWFASSTEEMFWCVLIKD